MPAGPTPPTDDWRVVDEVYCKDGDSDRAIRKFEADHPEITGQPRRYRVEITSHRDRGSSTVRFLWNEIAPEPSKRRKPRSR